jgi:hypothetical protein
VLGLTGPAVLVGVAFLISLVDLLRPAPGEATAELEVVSAARRR